MNEYRTSEKAFTRNRKLSFVSLILLQLNMLKQSLQKELVHFFDLIQSPVITKSAFCQSRMKLKPEAFLDLNDTLMNAFYDEYDFSKWEEFRLVAIDGSTVNLPYSEGMVNFFGTVKNQTDIPLPLARISACYDIMNDVIIDAIISPYTTSEYTMAVNHSEKLKKGDMAIFDRGYGAIWLFFLLKCRKIDFVTRISRSLFPEFWASEHTSEIITVNTCSEKSKKQLKNFNITFNQFQIRLVKVMLDTGETEVLVTSLLDTKKYPDVIFKQLYSLRWGIEVCYNHLKNHIELENFSGKSVVAVKQDFYANVFIENIRSLIAREAQIEVNDSKKKARYRYKVNKNLSIGFLKNEIVKIFLSDDPMYIEKIIKLFTLEPVPIRKGRQFVRKFHKMIRRYHSNYRRSI